ncbi:MAG: HpcH/HpaI aldolase/citrate lyase family protein [Bacillota bacterium]
MKTYRSVMFAPGIDRRKVEKAMGLGADVVILDLEDSVDISRKAEAREIVVSVLKSRSSAVELWVRVNPPETDFFLGDIIAVVAACPDGIMLPKAETAEGVARADWLMGLLEVQHGIEKGSIGLVPLVESAQGVRNAGEIATSAARVKRLSFGAVDYTLDMGIELTKETAELFYARSALAVASRSAGLEGPIDTVYTDVKDGEGLAADCRLARSLGFQGKLVIHPAQVQIVNNIFSPTAEELTRARKVVEAYEAALAVGSGVAQLDGKLIEKPVAMRARKILEAARSLGLEV